MITPSARESDSDASFGLRSRLGVIGLTAASIAAHMAAAPDARAEDVELYKRFGGFVSYAFGAEQPWGFGVETRMGAREEGSRELLGCVYDGDEGKPFFYGGGALRLAWYPNDHVQMLLAAQVGRAFVSVLSGLGELGLGYRWGKEAGLVPSLGAELGLSYASLALHVDPSRVEFSPVLGAYSEPLVVTKINTCRVVPGRPLRTENGAMVLPKLVRAGAAAERLASAAFAAGRVWGQRARTELASVPAFLRLAAQLRELNAPPGLVKRCCAAAADELRHAWMAAQLSADLSGESVGLSYEHAALPARPYQKSDLIRMALDNWMDGCLGEAGASQCASAEAQLARHRGARDTLRVVAREEDQHAALAWDVLFFLIRAGGRDVREVLHAATRTASRSEDDDRTEQTGLEAFGILGPEGEREILRSQQRASVARLREVLAAA